MRLSSFAIPAIFALCGFGFALPADACPKAATEANASPVVLAADDEDEAVMEDLRPDEVPAKPDAEAKGSANDHSQHEDAGTVEDEAVQKDLAPGTVPSGE